MYFIYIVIHLFSVMEVVTLGIWMSFLNTIVEAGIFVLFWVFCNSSARYHNWIFRFLEILSFSRFWAFGILFFRDFEFFEILSFQDFQLSRFCFFEILSFSRFWAFGIFSFRDFQLSGFSAFDILFFRDFEFFEILSFQDFQLSRFCYMPTRITKIRNDGISNYEISKNRYTSNAWEDIFKYYFL